MAIGDILSGIGHAAETVGKAAVPVLQRVAEVESGQAPKIDEEKRRQAEKLEDEQIAAKAQVLENNLAMGQKYGTLTPQQQDEYVNAITDLYKHPRHAPTLMEKLRKAIHPNGAYASAPEAPLTNPVPAGGTAEADERRAAELARQRRTMKAYASPDGKERNWFVPGEEPEGWQAVQGAPHQSTAKSPPTPGNQIPPDALGPDGQPIPNELRTPAQTYIQWNGAWYTAPKQKPIYKIIKGNVVLMDPATGLPQRNLGPSAGVKITSHQTPFLGDDGQMHLLTTQSVTTPQGEKIDVEQAPDQGEGTPQAGAEKPSAPPSKTSAKKVNPGSILPKTGAKQPSMGPAIPGSHQWALSRSLEGKSDASQYTKAAEDARAKKQAYENAAGLLADNSRQTDLELIYAWVRSNVQGAGRMTNTEIQQTATAGSWGMRIKNAMSQASSGRLAPEMEQQFLSDIKRSYDNAQKEADNLQKTIGGNPPPTAPDNSDPLGLFK